MSADQAMPDWTDALYVDPHLVPGVGSVRSVRTGVDQASDQEVSRARVEPPFVRSVRSVRTDDETHTSNKLTSPLTCVSNTSNTSNTDSPNLLAGVRTGTWLNDTEFEPLRYAVPGLLPEGFCLLAGPPKAGKSWVALDWLLSIAAGGRALGQIATGEARRVLYFALEDSDRRMQDRCGTVLLGAPIPEMFHYTTEVEPNLLAYTIAAFLEQYDDTALVVIDTLGKVMPPMKAGDTTYQRDYRVGSWLHKMAIARPGLAVVAVHHTRKTASTDFVDTVSGTNGLAGAADTIMVLSRDRNSSEGKLQVTGRDIEEAEYGLTSAGGRWALDGADLSEAAEAAQDRKDLDNLSPTMRDIMMFVDQRPEGVRAAEVADKFGKTAHEYLRRLLEAGHLDKLARGIYVVAETKKLGGHHHDTNLHGHRAGRAEVPRAPEHGRAMVAGHVRRPPRTHLRRVHRAHGLGAGRPHRDRTPAIPAALHRAAYLGTTSPSGRAPHGAR